MDALDLILALHSELRAAGLDVAGVCMSGPREARITGWNVEPTKEQTDAAESILKNFNWDRRAKTEEELKQEIAAFTPDQRMKLIDRLIIELGLAKPEAFESAKSAIVGVKR